jgi:predicted ATPase
MDFGLAKIKGSVKLTKTSSTIGTLAYMSPEQIEGKEIDARADIFSFGVVLYELLSGKLPFKGEYKSAIMYSIMNEEPESVKNIRSECSESLANIVTKCLQKKPQERFQSMQEIITAFEDDSYKFTFKKEKTEKHNLPIQLTSFIGREKEIETVKKLLTDFRLVTLTGAGGCGKTRLALEVAENLIGDYEDGVWFVDFAPLTNPNLLINEVASVLKIKEKVKIELVETVLKEIIDKNILIILDNCEHLISSCSELAEKLLKSVSGLTLLVTSREALNISGELGWRVPSLSLPDIEKHPDIDELIRFESIQLFTQRAITGQPSFELSEQNVGKVAQICSRLDGIPLAIELAAARIKVFDADAVLERLDDRFHLLTGGVRTALERHKTLKATIDWSYDLLSDKEKILFNRLSVFVGGCTIEAAEKICGTTPLDYAIVDDLFSSLIEKSLVVTDTTAGTSYRYRLLETIRHYAREKLYESGESDLIRESHLQYYLDMSENAYSSWVGEGEKWLITLETEHDNLRAALEWSKNRPVIYTRLAGALSNFWQEHSHINEGYEYLDEALQKHNIEDEGTARALLGKARFEFWYKGNPAMNLLERSLSIWRKLNNKRAAGMVIAQMASLKGVLVELESMKLHIEEAIRIFEELGDEKLLLHAKSFECWYYVHKLETNKVEVLAKKNITDSKRLNLKSELILNQHCYADAAVLSEDYREGELRYGTALKTCMDIRNINQALYEMRGLSYSLSGQKRFVKAVRLQGAIKDKYKELGSVEWMISFWKDLNDKHFGRAEKELDKVAFQKAEDEGRQMGFEKAVEYALDFDRD